MSSRNSRRFKELADLLRMEAGRQGVALVAGEAEMLLADRVGAVAGKLGVTERTALESYFTDELVAEFARTLGSQAATYREVARDTAPVTITVPQVGRVVAALGMAIKLAAEHSERTRSDSAGVAHDAADALVGIGAAVASAEGSAQVELGGQTLVWVRGVLVRTIELLRDRQWPCPCRENHRPGLNCTLLASLTRDLNTVGGWIVDQGEEPADRR